MWRAQDLYIEAEEGQAGKVVITDPDGSDPEVRTYHYHQKDAVRASGFELIA